MTACLALLGLFSVIVLWCNDKNIIT